MTGPGGREDNGPTIALTAVPAQIPASTPATPRSGSSGDQRRMTSRTTAAITMTSRRFPIVCPTAPQTGIAVY